MLYFADYIIIVFLVCASLSWLVFAVVSRRSWRGVYVGLRRIWTTGTWRHSQQSSSAGCAGTWKKYSTGRGSRPTILTIQSPTLLRSMKACHNLYRFLIRYRRVVIIRLLSRATGLCSRMFFLFIKIPISFNDDKPT